MRSSAAASSSSWISARPTSRRAQTRASVFQASPSRPACRHAIACSACASSGCSRQQPRPVDGLAGRRHRARRRDELLEGGSHAAQARRDRRHRRGTNRTSVVVAVVRRAPADRPDDEALGAREVADRDLPAIRRGETGAARMGSTWRCPCVDPIAIENHSQLCTSRVTGTAFSVGCPAAHRRPCRCATM